MKSTILVLVLLISTILFTGCSDNPAGLHNDEFVTQLTFTPDHVHTLAPVEFEVTIQDHDGVHVTDFEQVTVERRLTGTDTWRSIEMSQHADHYTGTYTFTSSGDYEVRVMGMAHAGHALEEMHHLEGGLHVGRAHAEQAGYRIEYESFPGHIHEGDTPTVTFWILDAVQRTPITGLSPEVTCQETGMSAHLFTLAEATAGEYSSGHQFEAAGPATVSVAFQDPQAPGTVGATFNIEVAHVH